MLAKIPRPLIDARNFRDAHEQTIDAPSFVIEHNHKHVVLITLDGDEDEFVSHIDGAIVDGDYVGHPLTIIIMDVGQDANLTIENNRNTKLRGDWKRTTTYTYLQVVWDGNDWVEVNTNDGSANTVTGPDAHAEGTNNTASGGSSHAEGYGNVASHYRTHAEGMNNIVSGENAHVEGFQCTASGGSSHAEGYQCTASGGSSHARGYRAQALLYGQHAWANGNYGTSATRGECQATGFMLHLLTTNNTPTEMISPERFVLEDEKSYACTVTIHARQDTGANHAMYKRMLIIERTGGTVALAGTVQTIGTDIETDVDWDVTLTADDTNKSLKVEVTGDTGQNVRWSADIEAKEISFSD